MSKPVYNTHTQSSDQSSDQFLDRLVDTITSTPVEATDEDRAFYGCFVPGDTPLIPPLLTAPIAVKLDFIVARAFYFNPRLSMINVGGEDMLCDGNFFYETREDACSVMTRLAHMALTATERRLSFARLIDVAPRANISLIEVSPTLTWDKDAATLIDTTGHTDGKVNGENQENQEEKQGEEGNDN